MNAAKLARRSVAGQTEAELWVGQLASQLAILSHWGFSLQPLARYSQLTFPYSVARNIANSPRRPKLHSETRQHPRLS